MKKSKKVLALATAALLAVPIILSGCSGSGSSSSAASTGGKYSGTITLGMSSWIGYAPLYVAQEKGFFKKEGADVQIKTIQSAGDRKAALASNSIQGMASTVDTHVMTKAAGVDIVQVLALDTSSGGDGVIAKKDIATFKDLKGKTVALDTSGGASYFWFCYLLKKNGMTLSDVKVQNMSAGDAGAAFVAGKVDAAVTWQPWLTNAQNTSFGKVLVSSKETPGIIVDTLGMRGDFVKKYPDSIKAIVKGWYDALEYEKTNPDDADTIMGKAMGETKDEFVAQKSDVTFYDKAGNEDYFGNGSKKGQIYDVTQNASDLWYSLKLIDSKVSPDSLINGSFVK